ncbi:MAG TPA: glycosyltransferase [Candidatus Baltobacteraceae bacterium]|nr:glycosyltransferase [Candidatus Baltobacteraceae bacterium]
MTGERVPDVSVLITSYNYARYLGRAIESALAQEDVELEVVVSDNCSTDDSVAVARRYESDPRFRLVVRDEPSPEHFNAILDHARGRHVLFLNADDYLFPGALRRLFALKNAPHVDVPYAAYAYVDANGVPYAVRRYEGLGAYAGRNELGALLTRASHIGLGTMLIERAWFEELGRFSVAAASHGDLEWCLRLAAAGKRFGYSPEPVLAVRRHGDNDSSPASFHANGRSLDGLLTCLERYVTPANARALRGWDVAIVVAVRHFFAYLQHLGVWEAPAGEAQTRFAAVERRLAAIEAEPYRAAEGWPRVTVALTTDGRRPALLLDSIRSALAQTYRDFEVVVVGTNAASVEPLLRAVDADARVRFVQQLATLDVPPPRTNAVELGRGEIVAYLREGDVWDPAHLAQAVAAIDAGAAAVRTRARRALIAYDVAGDGSVPPAPAREIARFDGTVDGTIGASEVWNAIPLSSVVHRRRAFDLAGKFDPSLAVLDELAFLMRLQRAVGIVALDAETVEERTVVNRTAAPWSRNWPAFIGSLDAIWRAFPADPETSAKRERYRANLQQAQSALAAGDDAGLLRAAVLVTGAHALA